MYFLYSFFLTLSFLALLPYFLYQAFHNKKYLNNFRERLGSLPHSLQAHERPTIWIHAVSVGETLAAKSLVSALRQKFPDHRIIFTTTTATGQAVARSRISDADGFCYYPFDWKFSVRKALDTIRPNIVILMESELWPNFLRLCQKQGIPVLVANGRVSDRSFRRSQKFGFWFRRITNNVSRFLMQSEADAHRIIALGAASGNVEITGNIKYDLGHSTDDLKAAETARIIAHEFNLSATPVIVAGSTSDGEEEMILAAFDNVRQSSGLETVRLIIAPRHPERFEQVAKILDSTRYQIARRSSFMQSRELAFAGTAQVPRLINNPARRADVILLDSVGELSSLYKFASVVFVGGSLVAKGGHNILEPAQDSKPIIVGPYTENFREITAEFKRRDAVIQLEGSNEMELANALGAALIDLLRDAQRAQELGKNAMTTVTANRGATAKTVMAIADYL